MDLNECKVPSTQYIVKMPAINNSDSNSNSIDPNDGEYL